MRHFNGHVESLGCESRLARMSGMQSTFSLNQKMFHVLSGRAPAVGCCHISMEEKN